MSDFHVGRRERNGIELIEIEAWGVVHVVDQASAKSLHDGLDAILNGDLPRDAFAAFDILPKPPRGEDTLATRAAWAVAEIERYRFLAETTMKAKRRTVAVMCMDGGQIVITGKDQATEESIGKSFAEMYAGLEKFGVGCLKEDVEGLRAALLAVEENCPCGARPETLATHPHVIGCPVGDALQRPGLGEQYRKAVEGPDVAGDGDGA